MVKRKRYLEQGGTSYGRPRFLRLSGKYGLQAHMTISYVRVTVIVVLVIICLYAAFLAGNIGFILSQRPGIVPASQVASYPWQAAIVMIGLTFLLTPLLGGLFGTLTTRGLVRRVHNLVGATTEFANGDYAQKVPVSGNDEIGQLEYQFNRMAQQLAESIAQRQALAAENARMAERARISRELHDAVSQDLFSLRMLTDGLHMALPADSNLQPQITMLEQTATNMVREMRALLLEMRPTQLTDLGLAAALEELATIYRARLGVSITTELAEIALPAKIEHILLRVAQEALANAVRHADATSIALSLAHQEHTIALTIVDNGKGFLTDGSETQHGLGLRLIRERVHELHGRFELITAPKQGTRIQVCLPEEQEYAACRDC